MDPFIRQSRLTGLVNVNDLWYRPLPPASPPYYRNERPVELPYSPQVRQSSDHDQPLHGHLPSAPTQSRKQALHIYSDRQDPITPVHCAHLPKRTEAHFSFKPEGPEYRICPSPSQEDVRRAYANERPHYDIHSSFPLLMLEDDATPFIPPPLHLQPAMFWTSEAPRLMEEEEEYRFRLDHQTPEVVPFSIELPPLSEAALSDYDGRQQCEAYEEDAFEQDGFELTGSLFSGSGVVPFHQGLEEEVMEKDRSHASPRMFQLKDDLTTPKYIDKEKKAQGLHIGAKNPSISSPTIAISPNKFWESLMKKNEKVQQQKQRGSAQTRADVTSANTVRADTPERLTDVEVEIKRKVVGKDSRKRKKKIGQYQKKQPEEDVGGNISGLSTPPAKRTRARKASHVRPAKTESRSDRYKRMRGELVTGKGIEVVSWSSSSSEEEVHELVAKKPRRSLIRKPKTPSPIQFESNLARATKARGRGRPPKLTIAVDDSDSEAPDMILIDSPFRDDTPSPRLSPTTEKAFKLATADYEVSNERKDSMWISLTELLGITKSDENAWNEEMHDESMKTFFDLYDRKLT